MRRTAAEQVFSFFFLVMSTPSRRSDRKQAGVKAGTLFEVSVRGYDPVKASLSNKPMSVKVYHSSKHRATV